jgi:hypothetical protein
VADSMQYVAYRLSLLKSVKSSKFPAMSTYSTWFRRQVHAVWLALLWTMQTQVLQKSAAAGGAAPVSSIPLPLFKQTLQLVQLLSFTLSSKVDTKLFVHGDAAGDASHPDLLAQLTELERIIHLFPVPFTSLVTGALHYPQLMLNKVYKFLLHCSCIAGGELGQPRAIQPSTESDESDADEESSLRLHSDYLAIIASLSSVRAHWQVPDFYHYYSLLHLILHIIYFQAREFDGRLLDADSMLEGDASILTLLSYVSNAISGHLRAELLALSPVASPEKAIKPEQLDDDENSFICFALRNIGYALSDFQRYQAKPVAVWSVNAGSRLCKPAVILWCKT